MNKLGNRALQSLRQTAWPWLILAGLVGLGLGLLVGWVIFPVDWYDTDPSDLRAQHKATYVLGVADSLAVTGDTPSAKARIYELTDDEVDLRQVATLVEQVALEREAAGDKAAALRVRRMAVSVGLPAAGAPGTGVPAAGSPATGASASAPRRVNTGRLLMALGVALIVLAAALLAVRWYMGRRQGAAPAAPEEPAVPEAPAPAPVPQARRVPWAPAASDEAPAWAAPQATAEGATTRRISPPQQAGGGRPAGATPTPSADEELDEEDYEEVEPAAAGATLLAGEADLPNGTLGVYEAEYRHGDDDYDCSFSIESERGEFYGECGLSTASVLQVEHPQRVNAFQIWLFDKSDIRTVAQILVTKYAYENEALNAQLSSKGELVLAEVGRSIALETLYLQATAIIKEFSYLPDEAHPQSAFAHVVVELIVEQANN